MKTVRPLLLGCGAVLLAACSSVPMHFYTLVPAEDGQRTTTSADTDYKVAVLPVAVPLAVDRPQLVVRRSDGTMSLLENRHWVAPLGEEIRSVLSSNITRTLGTTDVSGLAGGGNVPIYRIKVKIDRFESIPGDHTSTVASWRVHRRGDDSADIQCTSRMEQAVNGGFEALITGHQHGLRSLSDEITRTVQVMDEQGEAACP